MQTVKTPIVPLENIFAKNNKAHTLHKEAICVFLATGFFLDTDTYWKDKIVLKPATINHIDNQGVLKQSKPWFKWHYTPRDITFDQTLKEFTALFHSIIDEQVGNKKVILPISGGLDSRTQAVALKILGKKVHAYSYDFKGGYPETRIAKQIAQVCDFPFSEFHIGSGYLWNCIEELASINACYSEFTHPRQMAIRDSLVNMGDVFSLGHLGDLFFDSFNLPQLTFTEEVNYLVDILIKKGGLQLAENVWQAWGLKNTFKEYFTARISALLKEIPITDTNAKLRAFKTQYYVSRWSSNNLSIFKEIHPITLPYYHYSMCEFVCTIPEAYMAGRKLQIAYIKQQMPALAKITWQNQKPFNLYNYSYNKIPYNLPYRIVNKLKREIKTLFGNPYIQRNWELQFLGDSNEKNLKNYLFSSELEQLIPSKITQEFYRKFESEDTVTYSHPISMLLTLALKMKQLKGA